MKDIVLAREILANIVLAREIMVGKYCSGS